MKNKKKYLVLILISIIILACMFAYRRTEAPRPNGIPLIIDNEESIIKDNVLIVRDRSEISTDNLNKVDNIDKYKIVDRDSVVPEDIINKTKVVLLTIDDGPSKRTKEIQDILNKHNAKAIFFVNGINDKNHQGVIGETYKQGFAVGNHTWSHLNLKKEKDMATIAKEIKKDSDLIKNITGIPPRFFRAPYGESTPSIRKLVKDNGMIFMDWSGSAKDWEKDTKEKDVFISNAILNLHSGSILLIHEHPWSLANLDGLLTAIEAKGYSYIDPSNIIE